MRRIAERRSIADFEAFMRRRYETEGATQEQIAAELEVDASTIARWMAHLGIEARLFASERVA